ncbi:MAG: DEAD/DEAH box helicase family protein [Candidatus Lokiarchaeota archaeon]|nr:DEAD/DEAH box helicase family protein [Candidatus Harpocratesius repetitus]
MVSTQNIKNTTVYDLYSIILNNPLIYMFWGDSGVGKTTISLQIAKFIMKRQDAKVLYLNTKETLNLKLISRLFGIDTNSTVLNEIEIENTKNRTETTKIMDGTNKNNKIKDLQFYYFHYTTVKSQYECITRWMLQIQQYIRLFGKNNVKLIIIDEITSSYLVEMRKDQTNENLNYKMLLILSTLKKIVETYQIPIILLNTFTIKETPDLQKTIAVPHGGKILDFWIDFEIKMTRVPLLQVINFEIKKNLPNFPLLKSWKWKINFAGFQ